MITKNSSVHVSKNGQTLTNASSVWVDNAFETLFPQMTKILMRVMPRISFEEAEDAVQEYLGYVCERDSLAVELAKGKEIYISNLVSFCRKHYGWTTQHRGTQIADRIYNNVKSHAEQSKDVRYKTENGVANSVARIGTKSFVDVGDCHVADELAISEFEQHLKSEGFQQRLLQAFTRLYDDKGELHYKVFMEEAYKWEDSQQERADKLGVTLRQYRELNTQNNETIKFYGKEFFGL